DRLGTTWRVAVTGLPGSPADRITGVASATAKVVTGKVIPVVLPGTVTVAGTTAAAGLLLTRGTTTPPGLAGCDSTTCPVVVWPPITGFGETRSWATLAALGDVGGSYSTM